MVPLDPWLYVWLAVFLLMPVRFILACLMYGPTEALKLIGGYWLGFMAFAGGGAAILTVVIKTLPKLLPDIPAVPIILYAAICVAFLGYLWLIGFVLSSIDNLRHRIRATTPATEEDVREALRALKGETADKD